MEESQRQEIARAVSCAKDEILRQTVFHWPTTDCAPAFAALLAQASAPGLTLRMLAPRTKIANDDVVWLRERTEVTLLDPGGATLRERCLRGGITRLVTATLADIEPDAAVEWSFLLEGVSPRARAMLTYERGVRAADPSSIIMHRLRKLGYL